jgi:hypothetical protein
MVKKFGVWLCSRFVIYKCSVIRDQKFVQEEDTNTTSKYLAIEDGAMMDE